MKTIKVKIERNKDGFGVYAENEVFSGMGNTLHGVVLCLGKG